MFTAHLKNCKKPAKFNCAVKQPSGSLFACTFIGCGRKFRFKVDLYDHFVDSHKVGNLKPPETIIFDSFKEFGQWMTELEDATYSYFSQQYGRRSNAMYLYCQHDGRVKSHRKSERL